MVPGHVKEQRWVLGAVRPRLLPGAVHRPVYLCETHGGVMWRGNVAGQCTTSWKWDKPDSRTGLWRIVVG